MKLLLAFLISCLGAAAIAADLECPVDYFEEGPQHLKANLNVDVDDGWPLKGWITKLTFDKGVRHVHVDHALNEYCNRGAKFCSFENENHNREVNKKIVLPFDMNDSDWDKPNFVKPKVVSAKIASKAPGKRVWYELCQPIAPPTTPKPIFAVQIPPCTEFYRIEAHNNMDHGHGCSYGYKNAEIDIEYSKRIVGFHFQVKMNKPGVRLDIQGVDNLNRQPGQVFNFKSYDHNAEIDGTKTFKLSADWPQTPANCKSKALVDEISVTFLGKTEIICRGQ